MVSNIMADKKTKKDKNDSNSDFSVKGIDPKVQDKVDSYMDPSAKEQAKDQTAPAEASQAESEGAVSGAPLLPSDKIPQSVSSNKKPDPKTEPEPIPESAPKTEPSKEELPAEEPAVSEAASSSDDWPDPDANKDNLNLENSATSRAVDEIVASESDRLLETEDKAEAENQQQVPPKHQGRLKSFLKSKKFFLIIFWLLLIAAAAAMIVPTSRYYILNAFGVRASTSMRVVDAKTTQPLKDVEVLIDGQSAKTDRDGEATLHEIKLGKHTLSIKKPAFAEISRQQTIGWGSNPLGNTELKPVGAQYRFVLTDFLSDKPLPRAVVASGEASASANKEGEAVLVVEETDQEAIEVSITADNYRQETVKVSPDKQQLREIAMVPSRKHAFVSQRSGTYDLYKVDVDGENEELVLAGTGTESEDDLILVNHPTEEVAAFVSIRGEARSSEGDMLSTLQVIDLGSDKSTKVVSSARVQIVDWVGDRLIYVKEQSDKKLEDPARHKLMSYDRSTGEDTTLASANYFNDVSVAKGVVYYSPAGSAKNVGLYTINVDSSGKSRITKEEAWNIFRTSYDNLKVSLGQRWYDYNLDNGSFNRADGPPSTLKSRVYYDSPDRTKSLWSEDRDGKGTLIVYDHDARADEIILSQGGLKNPLRWLDDRHVVFRLSSTQETADYALSLDGGESKKITDVTNVTGIDRWYFY
jgi:hypothetical protein